MRLISLKEVLEEMEKGEQPFSIVFVTLDRKKGTGGKITRIEKAMQSGSKKVDNYKESIKVFIPSPHKKKPNHYTNRTRNLRILGTSQIRKIRIRLIIEFNGQTVFY